MRINGEANVVPPRHDRAKPGGPDRGRSRRPLGAGDSVEISSAAQKLQKEGKAAAGRTRTSSSEERDLVKAKAEIQAKIASGFYDRDEVVREVAKKILDLLGL